MELVHGDTESSAHELTLTLKANAKRRNGSSLQSEGEDLLYLNKTIHLTPQRNLMNSVLGCK